MLLATPRRALREWAAAGLLISKPGTAFGSQHNSAIELGIIGCGGLGNWIGGHLNGFHGRL